jgi:uncharacterized membrane protein
MSFQSPVWIILVPLLALLGKRYGRLRLFEPLRLGLLFLTILALMNPQINLSTGKRILWVLFDKSSSSYPFLQDREEEWKALLEQRKEAQDELRFIDFADSAQVQGEGDGFRFARGIQSSRIGEALQFVLQRLNDGDDNRILLFSDGYSTTPLEDVESAFISARVPVDYRLVKTNLSNDIRVLEFSSKPVLRQSESNLLRVRIFSGSEQSATLEVFRDGQLLDSHTVFLKTGENVFRFVDPADHGANGGIRYEVNVVAAADKHPQNNSAYSWSQVVGAQAILLISPFENDTVRTTLQNAGVEVRSVKPSQDIHAGLLAGSSVVILNNVHAAQLSRTFQEALAFWVKSQGGGLLILGGENSFGSGGYYQSPIDPILPVDLGKQEEERRPPVAVAFVLDRSGSMSASAGTVLKMDLANEGAAKGIELLETKDSATILAVDTEPHVVIPLTEIQDNYPALVKDARSITSGGGGIYVYTGVQRAWEELKKAEGKQKHIILFADASDAEEPGNLEGLLTEIRQAKGTVSVIAVGSPADKDAAFLRSVAEGGRGRMFFVEDAQNLPAVFVQETSSLTRSLFLRESTTTAVTSSWSVLGPEEIGFPAVVDGYNLSKIREGATVLAVSQDSYKAPLAAVRQSGSGKAAAIAVPMSGAYSQAIQSWPGYRRLLLSFVRYVQKAKSPKGVAIKAHERGERMEITLSLGAEWRTLQRPQLVVYQPESRKELVVPRLRSEPQEIVWQVPLRAGEFFVGAIQAGDAILPVGPFGMGKNPEWDFQLRKIQDLKNLSERTGGVERLDLGSIWELPRRKELLSLQPYLLTLFLWMFLLEALLERLNMPLRLNTNVVTSKYVMIRKRNTSKSSTRIEPPITKEKDLADPPKNGKSRAFEKAKRRGL